jgi:hypothetical protein
MPPWIYIWLFRLLSGERLRKADKEDYRLHLGFFFWTPILIFLGGWLGERYVFDKSALVISLAVFGYTCLGMFLVLGWAKIVPAVVSLVLGLIEWGIVVWWFVFRNPIWR